MVRLGMSCGGEQEAGMNDGKLTGKIEHATIGLHGDGFCDRDFRGSEFKRIRFIYYNFSSVDFSDSLLERVFFEDCTLTEVSFKDASLERVVFIDCSFKDVNFSGADLVHAEIYHISEISNITVDGARVAEHSELLDDWIAKELIGTPVVSKG